ncbi:MAG: ThiF family adenylyltransferase [Candidatus Cryptobacteroides sp.]
MEDWKERTRLLVGDGMLEHFDSSHVAVIGVGGVGGYAAEMLARAGVGHITILDADTVSVTNKNRQILALDSTVGKSKCEVMAGRLMDINPSLDLTVIDTYLEADRIADVLGGRKIDFLVDAIDTLAPKLALIKYCVDNGIAHVSSMGAGAKYDVTQVRVADISKSFNCPLAYIVRKRLRHMGISKGFKVVFSEELPQRESIVPCTERNKKSMTGTIAYLPAVFGCACAQVAIRHLMESNSVVSGDM